MLILKDFLDNAIAVGDALEHSVEIFYVEHRDYNGSERSPAEVYGGLGDVFWLAQDVDSRSHVLRYLVSVNAPLSSALCIDTLKF